MSRLDIMTPSHAQTVIDGLYRDVERRIAASPPGLCPVDLAKSFLDLCHAQTCGKCVPCRIGLGQLSELMEQVLEGEATMETISIIERVARVIVNSADCAIGRDAARLVLDGVQGFRDDYEEHILRHRCLGGMREPVPCVALCPAGVDVPGYMALVGEGRCADAVRLIRKDNPFPTTCGFICEHPCEARCRRNMVDDAVNIRGLKRFAADYAGFVEPPECAPSTGKKVAVLGGGPGGLSAAYYLQLMGHQTTVYEMLPKLGGMLRYGIPNYRLPKDRLDDDINAILKTGVEVKQGLKIGVDITIQELREQYDAVLITIGASTDKKLGLPGEDADGVLSAVQFLRSVGKDEIIDLTGKEVVVIGGGNVSMDAVRTAKRLGAKKVSILYRRRRNDMTALPGEIEGRSFAIITKELEERGIVIPKEQEPVTKRVIHTSADFGYADTLTFSENAVEIAKHLIRTGADIVTDTNMALSGVNKKVLEAHGGMAHCFMADEEVAGEAKERKVTRAVVSMEHAAKLDKPVIFAIGNAPTALIRLYELICDGIYRPAFIIGVPVGFVNVEVAKEMILHTDVPCIVNRGRKGGSNVAAAICNALLYEVRREDAAKKVD